MTSTKDRADRLAERMWREFIDDSKIDIKKVAAICQIYLLIERNAALSSPPTDVLRTLLSDARLRLEHEKELVGDTWKCVNCLRCRIERELERDFKREADGD